MTAAAAARGSPCDRELALEPRAPFALELTAWALRRRAHNAIDCWDGRVYRRALALGDEAVAVSVAQTGPICDPRLAVTLSGVHLDKGAEATARRGLDRLLGLTVDLSGFAAMAAGDPLLARLTGRLRGLKPPRFPTVFEALVNGIACQQLSITVGIHLLGRLTAAYGRPVPKDPDELRAFPGPTDLASVTLAELNHMGFSAAKARTILEAAAAIAGGELDLESLERLDDRTAVEGLTRLYGVGRWTAEYVLLRGLGRLHVFPGDDVGARNKLKRFFDIERPLDYEGIEQLLARWHPYAGVIYFHLLLDSLTAAGLVAAGSTAPAPG
ncbi:MAG: DNA-3-methyladenine glycosylase 2 family protein [Solirubrobacterales bacterium]|nr:MAG: DNA-3-methyladenine glycosylase 2 family protein [Solirubrobacterales bacterium]